MDGCCALNACSVRSSLVQWRSEIEGRIGESLVHKCIEKNSSEALTRDIVAKRGVLTKRAAPRMTA